MSYTFLILQIERRWLKFESNNAKGTCIHVFVSPVFMLACKSIYSLTWAACCSPGQHRIATLPPTRSAGWIWAALKSPAENRRCHTSAETWTDTHLHLQLRFLLSGLSRLQGKLSFTITNFIKSAPAAITKASLFLLFSDLNFTCAPWVLTTCCF